MISTPVRPITQDYTSNPFNQSNSIDVPDEFPEVQEQTHNNYSDESIISLRTIPVVLENGRRRMKINTLLDDGSTKTYINSDVAHELGVHGKQKTIAVGVLGGRNSFVKGEEVTLTLISIDGAIRQEITAQTTTKVTGYMKATEWYRHSQSWEHLKQIKFPKIATKKTIDLLIGSDHIELHTTIKEIAGQRGEPVARLTPLGWTCVGRVEPTNLPRDERYVSFFCANQACEEFRLEKFWEVEEIPFETDTTDYMSREESDAVRIVKKTMKKVNGNRFQIGSPWKMKREGVSEGYRMKHNIEEIPNNFKGAYKRLVTTERSVRKKGVQSKYNEVFVKYLGKNCIRKVSKPESKDTKWLLAHFPILRFDKETTKIRIVFDASAKFENVSLNDFVLKGPKLQRDVFTIICRFRRHPIAIVCDISEMYLQIELTPEDRKYFRFLWRNCEDRAPDVYEFSRLVFGFSACPFLAQLVARENAIANKAEFPLASEAILESTYMDDTLDSVEDEVVGKEIYRELKEVWGRAGMSPRKWLSNSEEVLKDIPVAERAASVDLENSELPSSKTLGVRWNAKDDVFTFSFLIPDNRVFTKRTFLALTAAIFDPLGFLAPFIIIAKIIIQLVWLEGLDWDDKLPQDLDEKIQRWCDDLKSLTVLRVPRCVRRKFAPIHTTLHFFSDASKEAYATAAYLRTEYQDSPPCVQLVASKSKVAPLKVTSIPRLELMGATLSVRFASLLAPLFGVKEEDLHFWTDSMNVLWWISRRSKTFKTFVANRVGLIHRKSNPTQWRHVDGTENPADLATRGVRVAELHEAKIWWSGPEFLSLKPSQWPGKRAVAVVPTTAKQEELKKCKTAESTFTVRVIEVEEESKLNPNRYSSFARLVRVTAWVFRFIENCSRGNDKRITDLTTEELSDSENSIIKSVQHNTFSSELKALHKDKAVSASSPIVTFQPFIDDDGLLRSNSRLANAEFLPYNVKHPIILPRRDWVTKLIIRSYHSADEHTRGTNHTLADLSEKYIIPQAREEIRTTEDECNYCKKKKAKPALQIMAPLPNIRLREPLHAFNKISVDYAGPFIAIQGRGRSRAKRYLCLFTCLLSRGVHLELAYSLDTDSFLNAFYRMTSRRGLPEEAMSDNGSNFVSGNRELRELIEKLDEDRIHASLANKGVKWTFNPPLAPHFGGVHESMIKSAKRSINAVLQNADVNDEELHSAFVGVEDLLNSRPLTYQSSHPADILPLTPNHFLHGRVGGEFAADTVDTVDFAARKRWRRVQELVRHVWSRWMKEWVPELRRRKKWNRLCRNFEVGDLVLVIENDTPRGQWNLGRIEETYKGSDGQVRTVKLKIKESTYIRPITKLCHLELSKI